ncbi:helix-turn-helix transcriptional regulator [Rhodovulum marinum]|uniref:LuxR family transcriptional regulator n=1 Tax=Rhodovulum marinum TaxID=320662 RepID=A0A4R2Q7U6_9RHOB|nr:LuxR family transcriptional regulator [Rhodovulum marinum]TCP44124.1 LuxR family transcriptional regulator [Rhodovulum marinum]
MPHSSENKSGVPALDVVLPTLRLLGPSGFIFAYNITFRGPEYYHSEYPKAWQMEYESRGYTYVDPVLIWNILNTGNKRWSEVRLPDLRGVLTRARAYGLVYGASFSRTTKGKKTILTLARADREFNDEEILFLAATVDELNAGFSKSYRIELTVAELQTLRCLRDGMTYAEAAAMLNVSVPTIKARLEKVRGKLGAKTATQAVAMAVQRKLL